jgi:choline kinase
MAATTKSEPAKTKSERKIESLEATQKYKDAVVVVEEWTKVIEEFFMEEAGITEKTKDKALAVFKFMKNEVIRVNKSVVVMERYYALLASQEAETATAKAAERYGVSEDSMEVSQLKARIKELQKQHKELQDSASSDTDS